MTAEMLNLNVLSISADFFERVNFDYQFYFKNYELITELLIEKRSLAPSRSSSKAKQKLETNSKIGA